MGSEVKVEKWPYKILWINDFCGVGGDINCWGGRVWEAVFKVWGRRSKLKSDLIKYCRSMTSVGSEVI